MLLHIQTRKTQEKQESKKEKAKKRNKKVQTLYLKNTKLSILIFTVPLNQIYSQSNKEVISNLITLRSRPENASNKKILT